MRLTFLILATLISNIIFSQKATTNCLNHVNGTISSKQTGEMMPGATVYLKQNGKIIKESLSDEFGHFSFELDCDSRYQISAQYENHTENIKLVFTSKSSLNHDVKLELFPIKEFEKINNENRILVESIEFIPNDFSITPKAATQLNIVYALMEKYQHMNLEIRFHTDIRGDLKFLKSLTQKRADVCAKYLIKKGINSTRINAIGFGATQLLNHCKKDVACSNIEHLENRRTEFIANEIK